MAEKDPEIRKARLTRFAGSMPWFKAVEKERHRTKVFRSGNSLAVRIPAGTALKPGMEMDLTIENGLFLSYDPVEAPKRKFDIAKVAGSAKGLKYVEPRSRTFEPRPSVVDSNE